MAMKLPAGRATDIVSAVTAIAFVLSLLSGWQGRLSILAGFIPARVHDLGAQGLSIGVPWLPVWLTPISATLLHGGWMHLAFNLAIFVFCGRQVESLLGSGRMLLVYVVGAYAAAAAQWAANPAGLEPMIGASGAISAIVGSYALIYSQREVRAIGPIPAQAVRVLWMAAAWTGIQLMIGLAGLTSTGAFGRVAIWAHVGGFIAGLLLARPMLRWRFASHKRS